MTKVEERINNGIKGGILAEFLGAENMEALRQRIMDVIVEQIESDLKDSYEYIISPDDIAADVADVAFKEVKEMVISEIKPLVMEKMMKKMEVM